MAGADHKEIAKQSMKKVASETAVRKRMMEFTSKLTDFDWTRKEGHEECQRGLGLDSAGEKEKKRVRGQREEVPKRYRYANCSFGHSSRIFKRFARR
jgi:hypothetical protein